MFTGDSGSNCLTLQIAGPDLVRGIGYNLVGRQNSLVDQTSDEVTSHAEQLGGFRHRQPLAVLLSGTIGMDSMLAPHSTHARSIPRQSLPRTHAHTIE